jgi:acyl carrier protein
MEDVKLTADQVVSKVKEIIVDKLGVEESQVTDSANFINDLGADSLDTVELIMGFEKKFGIKVPDEETGIQTVQDAVNFIENQLKEAGRLA